MDCGCGNRKEVMSKYKPQMFDLVLPLLILGLIGVKKYAR